MDQIKQKVIGICFGHQIIALALGGAVEKNSNGWEAGPTKVHFEGPNVFETSSLVSRN
jgi:GMP synthase-like glutamine amidotransferase